MFIVFVGLLVIGHSAVLFWTSRSIWRSARDLERDATVVDTTHAIDRTLREHHRIENLRFATREPELEALRAELETDLRGLLAELASYARDPGARRMIGQLREQVTAYLTARQAVEARGLSIEQAVRALRPELERALATSAAIRQENEASRRASQSRAERLLRDQRLVVIASAVLLVLGLTAVALGVHRLVVRPILGLQDAVERFRVGDRREKVSGGPLFETRLLADRFNEMAEAIAQQRRDQLTFLAAVAHDLRNPLSAFKMIVQSLERDPAAATADRWARLDRQLDRLTRMVGDLLDATRIESGHLELQLEDFDLRDAARSMVDLYAPTTSTHVVTLAASDRPLIVHADPLRIEQVISNLLSNAIKYSPGGGPVQVSVSEADGVAVVSVSDRGVGIPPEELPNLFLPFRRRPSTAGLTPGVGLGLSIVRRIVDAHGGRIDVESSPGVGSTFRVRLPLEATRSEDVVALRPRGAPGFEHPEPR
jgi:signal transduction histidine kinase